MKRRISRGYFIGLYYLSWLLFGLVGLGLNIVCALLLPLPGRGRREAQVRRAIRLLFDLWLKWLHMSGVVRVHWRGFDRPLPRGAIYVANHPTLVDATVLLARLPDAICIFKPALMRNPAIGPAAIMAGYVSGGSGVDLIREVSSKVADGRSLLIFPEGTRTGHGAVLGKLRPGFALIAARARAPVQLVVIRSSPELGTRGRPWWQPPCTLPGEIVVTLDALWTYVPGQPVAELSEAVRKRLTTALEVSSA